jgi:hypothetical protein
MSTPWKNINYNEIIFPIGGIGYYRWYAIYFNDSIMSPNPNNGRSKQKHSMCYQCEYTFKKVATNENAGGSGRWQMFGIVL